MVEWNGGMEWWNGILEWNTGINNLMPKVLLAIIQIFRQLIHQLQIMYVHSYSMIDGPLARTTGALIFLLKMNCDESTLKKSYGKHGKCIVLQSS